MDTTLLSPILEYPVETLRPTAGHFRVEVRGERKTKSGIVVGDAFVTNHCQGTIIDVDRGINNIEWVPIAIKALKKGDKIMFLPNNKIDIPSEGHELNKQIMVPCSAIIGIYDTAKSKV